MPKSRALLLLALLGLLSAPVGAQVSLTTLGSPYSQSFDTLPPTGSATWTNNTTIPGWYHARTGTGTTIVANDGVSNAGNLYSYGTGTATDRALGSLGSGNAAIGSLFWGVRLQNNTGSTITSLDVSFTGEQWRNSAAAAQTIAFSYLVGSPTVTGSLAEFQTAGVTVSSLDFTSPITGGTAGALNGNLAANRSTITFSITGLSIPNGTEVMLRWSDPDHTGADHGLSIDDFSVTPQGGAPVPNLTVNDVSLNEGNAGTTSFIFTVSLSAPAGAGGVTFDITTSDGTAVQPGDYTQNSLTSQTIPAGSSTYSFTVLVNGDVTPETNETFLVNVTNVTGATVTDGQGQGTIVNDDAAPNLTINDVSLNEGNAGTTTFTFTVSLSAPAPAGGVTFDIATADGTATQPSDYTQKSLTFQTIPAGSSTYTFDVLVNGDVTAETNETFSVNVTNATNAIVTDGQGLGTIVNDDLTKIHDVQGNGAATPIPGTTVTVEAIVTASFQPSTQKQGFFLQEEDADVDADPATSEGIFVFCNTCPTSVVEGQKVRVTGTVSEFFNNTEITASTAGSVIVMSSGNPLPTPASIDLPVVGVVNDYYEPREDMRVTFVDTLSVSEYFELARYGQIELFEGGRPTQFTETNVPSVAGYNAHLEMLSRRRVILDDQNDIQNFVLPPAVPDGSQAIYHPHANGGFSVGVQGTDFFRGGDLVSGLTGVLDWSFAGLTGTDAWRVRPTQATPVAFTVANPRPVTPPAVGGAIKAVGMNLLNYFTTIDTTSSNSSGPCAPNGLQDCRGADSVAELVRQRERASIVICTLNADTYGFAELENTTPSASITDLLGAVNTRCGGAHPYAFANTGGTLGTDAIRVQIIYRTGILSPVGAPMADLDPIHSRPPTAQVFDVVDATNPAFGKRFTLIVNHFKSKGSSAGLPGDADAGDGAGASNATRTAQANRLLTWINGTVVQAAGDPDVLLVGDFNSYAAEAPVTVLTGGGYTDLETALLGPAAYSYLFDGQLGHLDYAFSSSSLTPQVTGVGAWHINADEADLFDYNDEVRDSPGEAAFEEKPDGSALVPPRVVYQPMTPYRASDHDPVLVGLFAVADLSITKTDSPDPVTAGTNLAYIITVTNSGPDAATTASWSDTLPAGTTFVSLAGPPGWSCTTPSIGSGGTVTCTASSFAVGSAGFSMIVNVDAGVASGTVLANTATVTSATSDPSAGNNSATATTTVVTSADASITKTDGVTTVTPGGSTTYTITASNAGPSNTAATVGDTFPATLTCSWTCVGAGGGTCTASGSGNINQSVSLPVGGSVTFTASCTISASATGTLSNTATVSTVATDPTPGNNSATDTDTFAAMADLSITKTDGKTTATPGGSTTYTITASNAGPSNAPGSTVADTFPASLTCTWTCVGAGGGTCTASGSGNINDSVNLPAGGSVTYTAACAISASATGSLSNTATVAAPAGVTDPTSGNNSATDSDSLAPAADIAISKTASSSTPGLGTMVTFTVMATNNGPSDATGVKVNDLLPVGLSFVSSAPSTGSYSNATGVWTVGSLANGASATLGITATVTRAQAQINQATTSGQGQVDPNGSNNAAAVRLNGASAIDIQTGISVDNSAPAVSQNVVFTVTAKNAGPATANGVLLTSNLPAGLTFVGSVPSQGTYTPGTGTWSVGTLASGATATLSLTMTNTVATQVTQTFTRTASTEQDLVSGNDAASSVLNPAGAFADISLTKIATQEPVAASLTFNYEIMVSNLSSGTATGVTVVDTLPAGVTLVSMAVPSQGSCSGTSTVTCNLGTLLGGSSATIDLTVTKVVGGLVSNSAMATANESDPNMANNSNTASTTPVALMEFGIE